ncbi:ribonuclease H-like domain-containing protein [Tanacetum coccineum]
MVILLVCFKIVGYPTDFGKNKSGQNFKGKNVSNNDSVGSSSSSEFTDEQMATLISLIKYNKIGKNVQMLYDDKRVDPNLNCDKKSKSDSSHSSVPGGDVTILEDNIFSEGNLDQNPSTSTQGTQTLNINSKPKSFYEASKFTHWTDAMNNEMDTLLRNDTWDIVDLPKDGKSRGSKWIFKIKYKPVSDKDVFLDFIVYVDDINITGNNVSEIDKFKVFLKSQFIIKDLGKLKYFLGIKPAKTPLMSKLLISNEASDNDHILDNITDYQKLMVLLPVTLHCDSTIKIVVNPVFHERIKHLEIDLHFVREKILKGVVKTVKVDSANQIEIILTTGLDTVQHKELVKKLEMVDIYQVLAGFEFRWKVEGLDVSSVDSHRAASDNDHILDNIIDYQKLMGKLIYLTNTRPNISYDVHCLGIHFFKISVKKQNTLSKSSTKAEYRALSSVTSEGKILKGVVKTVKVDSTNQIANILTTGLDTMQHKELVKKLEMVDIYQVLAGFEFRWKVEGLDVSSVDSHRAGQEGI